MKKISNASSAIDMYLNEISKIPLLTAEEEYQFSKEINKYTKKREEFEKKSLKKGVVDPSINKKLRYYKLKQDKYTTLMIQGNYRLVVSVAKKYYNNFLQLTDLIEEGNIGLIKAVSRFNPDRGYRFSTFAIWWIRQCIVKSIRDKGKIVKIPAYVEKSMNSYKQAISDYRVEFGTTPHAEKLQEILKVNKKKIFSLSNIPENFVSLSHRIGESDKEISDTIVDESNYNNPVSKTIEKSLESTLNSLLETLTEREKKIIFLRYGLNNNEPMVLDKIGKILGVTRERIRQIHAGALRKMREMGSHKNLEIFLE